MQEMSKVPLSDLRAGLRSKDIYQRIGTMDLLINQGMIVHLLGCSEHLGLKEFSYEIPDSSYRSEMYLYGKYPKGGLQ